VRATLRTWECLSRLRWSRGTAGTRPSVEAAGVHVLLDREEDPVAADEPVPVVVEAVVVAGQLVVGRVQELVELVLVLTDEDHVRLGCVECLLHQVPPPDEEGVVAADLLEVLVDASRAIELDQ
jgi:hypothetical protein